LDQLAQPRPPDGAAHPNGRRPHRLERSAKRRRVVLGLVASKVAELESADSLKQRIEEASSYIKLEQLGLSPQCGFATSADEHVAVTEEVERAKLARVVEVARQVWGSA